LLTGGFEGVDGQAGSLSVPAAAVPALVACG
jgi:hypothetical protein